MDHFIGLVWLIAIIIGGISTIVRAAQKTARTRAGAVPNISAPPPASLPVRISHQMQPAIPVSDPATAVFEVEPTPEEPVVSPVVTTVAAPIVVPVPTAVADLTAPRRGQIRLQFEERGTWVRALIAAEVLGPPLSLREQRFWSQPHNEPSI